MIQVDEQCTVTIADIAYGGDGVATLPDGMRVFVPFTALGDEVQIRIVEVHKRFARAQVSALITPGEGRCEPRCPVYGRCGGCCYQHLTRSLELGHKRAQLATQLQRLGKLDAIPEIELPMLEYPEWNYRNKITLQYDLQARVWGYSGVDQASIVAIDHCPIAMAPINEVMAELPGNMQSATLRCDAAGQVHLVEDVTVVIEETLLGNAVKVPLTGFYQVNPPVLEAMIRWLRGVFEEVQLHGFIDAYCGVGVMALGLADLYQVGIGIEGNRQAVKRARENAEIWGVEHVEFYKGQVGRHLPRYLSHIAEVEPSCVLLDPPRGGVPGEVAGFLRSHRPNWLVYIACDAAAMARDLKRILADDGFSLERLAMFNMFPQTAHFESIAVLRRRDEK